MPTTFIDTNCFDQGVAYNRNLVLSVLYESLVFKLAVLTYKIRLEYASTSAYLSYRVRPRESTRHLRSSTTPLLHRPTTRTHFADCAFRYSVPAVQNSLNTHTLCCSSLALFRHSLKTYVSSVIHLGLAL